MAKNKSKGKKFYKPCHHAVYRHWWQKSGKKMPLLFNPATTGFTRHWCQKTVVFFYFSVAPLHFYIGCVCVSKSSFFFAFLPLFNFLCAINPFISTFLAPYVFHFIRHFFCHFFCIFCHLNRVALSYQRFTRFFIFCHFFCHFSFFLPLLNPKEKRRRRGKW